MNTQEAEEKLKDYLFSGIRAELYCAKEARAVAKVIGDHSERLGATRFYSLFAWLNVVFSERETLCVAKIFDRPNKKFPVRSISSTLILIEENAGIWSLPERGYLEELLAKNGYDVIKYKSNEQIALAVVEYFWRTIPSVEKKDDCQLSSALNRVFQSRDKVHAHNEDILRTERTLPTWTDTKNLIEYAEEFSKTVSRGFLGLAEIITDPEATSRQFERLMGISKLVNEEYLRDGKNLRFIEILRKEIFESN
ncbi:MAG: hypothetical protein M3Q99_11245 [Acidobacteriota bacterium]|nr:hypothetical protein [Acidobacteriota bacterium]